MPRYVWINKDKEKVEVFRSISDHETPPTKEESKTENQEWQRVINTLGWTRGNNFRGGKGNWNG